MSGAVAQGFLMLQVLHMSTTMLRREQDVPDVQIKAHLSPKAHIRPTGAIPATPPVAAVDRALAAPSPQHLR
jgi:hypothetical protein